MRNRDFAIFNESCLDAFAFVNKIINNPYRILMIVILGLDKPIQSVLYIIILSTVAYPLTSTSFYIGWGYVYTPSYCIDTLPGAHQIYPD